MRRIVISVLALSMLLLCVACSKQLKETQSQGETVVAETSSVSQNTNEETEDGVVVGLSLNCLDEYQTLMYNGIVKYVEEHGGKVIMLNAENNVDKQISDIESLITQKVDVINFNSLDPDGLVPIIETAVEAGIPCLEGGYGINTDKCVSIVASQYRNGEVQYEYLKKYLDEDPDLNLNIIYLWGYKHTIGCKDRYAGLFENLEKNYKDRYTILAEGVTNFDVTEAISISEAWTTAFPETNCIASSSDELTIGALNTFKAAGFDMNKIITLGIDGGKNGRDYIRQGLLSATAYMDMDKLSAAFGEYSIRMAKGETFTEDILLEDVILPMTKENIDSIRTD